jgi:hypothetical protein
MNERYRASAEHWDDGRKALAKLAYWLLYNDNANLDWREVGESVENYDRIPKEIRSTLENSTHAERLLVARLLRALALNTFATTLTPHVPTADEMRFLEKPPELRALYSGSTAEGAPVEEWRGSLAFY